MASERLPAEPRVSLGVVFPRKSDLARPLRSRSILLGNANFGAPVVHEESPRAAVKSPLLTVREVAAFLRVCTATVYSLCERGLVPYVRISSAIRVHLLDLETLLRSQRKSTAAETAAKEE